VPAWLHAAAVGPTALRVDMLLQPPPHAHGSSPLHNMFTITWLISNLLTTAISLIVVD